MRNVKIKKDDKIKIVRGQFKGKIGNVKMVMTKKSKVFVENIQNVKNDGTKTYYPLDPSNLIIIELNLTDKKRKINKNE